MFIGKPTNIIVERNRTNVHRGTDKCSSYVPRCYVADEHKHMPHVALMFIGEPRNITPLRSSRNRRTLVCYVHQGTEEHKPFMFVGEPRNVRIFLYIFLPILSTSPAEEPPKQA
jgi:hypothetical protein